MNTTSEYAFEAVIETELLEGGYKPVVAGGFECEPAMFPVEVLAFIREKQPKEWRKLESLLGDKTSDQVLSDLSKRMGFRRVLGNLAARVSSVTDARCVWPTSRRSVNSIWIYLAEEVERFATIYFKPKKRQSIQDHQAMTDQLFFDQIVEVAVGDEGLRQAAAANPEDKFELVFRNLLENRQMTPTTFVPTLCSPLLRAVAHGSRS